MSELRQDPVTKEWVIIATERKKRPSDFTHAPDHCDLSEEVPAFDPDCPFCPGNESQTPDAIWENATGAAWTLRVIPNKFPALDPSEHGQRWVQGLNRTMEGSGHHEVIIETPDHSSHPALMDEREVADILDAYHRRYNELIHLPAMEVVTIFRNHGEGAGTSLQHPHSQIVATPIIPYHLRQKILQTMHHFDDTGRCIYCDLIAQERDAGGRVVLESDTYLVIVPFAAKKPYEMQIVPKRHRASFGKTSTEERRELGAVLHDALRRLYHALDDPDYNMVVHSAPYQEDPADYYHWRIRIVPRLTKNAGFEMGSGIYINPTIPEECASVLRAAAGEAVEQS